ncbi:MAG: carboxymethylenebutenolidase [Gammaproteobacteria bacterium]|nr:carboxymethylenebutenolidase [Gammaproteobacteria bacterium]
MGSIRLTAADGFSLSAYEVEPEGPTKGCVVVIQEVFGVNDHIREVCNGYATNGYHVVAPAIFDRFEPGVELGYEQEDMMRGVGIARGELEMESTLQDIQAAITYLSDKGKVAVVGYCFGGLMTWMAASNLTGLACASSYYGGGIIEVNELEPKVPIIMHFGELDAHIPLTDVNEIEQRHPDVPVYIYQADHGFNCDHRASFDADAAALARQRTLELFEAHLIA